MSADNNPHQRTTAMDWQYEHRIRDLRPVAEPGWRVVTHERWSSGGSYTTVYPLVGWAVIDARRSGPGDRTDWETGHQWLPAFYPNREGDPDHLLTSWDLIEEVRWHNHVRRSHPDRYPDQDEVRLHVEVYGPGDPLPPWRIEDWSGNARLRFGVGAKEYERCERAWAEMQGMKAEPDEC